MGLLEHVRMAPAGVVMLSVTEAVLVVAPPALSWMLTTGWVGKAIPPVEFDGLLVKASLVAVPLPPMLNVPLAAGVSPLEAAVKV